MRPSLPRSFSLLVLLGVLGSAGCTSPPAAGDTAAAAAVELRTYSIPPGYEGDVRSSLRQALGEDGVGRVAMGPTGQLIVLAPPAVHRGIEAFVKELAALPGAPAVPPPVTLDYWIVRGVPQGAERDRGDGDLGGPLGPIDEALARIVAEEGPQRFELVEHLRLSSLGDDGAQLTGRVVSVHQNATFAQGVVVAELLITMGGHRLQTHVRLDPGQIVVLGESSTHPDYALYYLITASTD